MMCEYEGCENEASSLCSTKDGYKNLCNIHIELELTSYEYGANCPKCGCTFGVG